MSIQSLINSGPNGSVNEELFDLYYKQWTEEEDWEEIDPISFKDIKLGDMVRYIIQRPDDEGDRQLYRSGGFVNHLEEDWLSYNCGRTYSLQKEYLVRLLHKKRRYIGENKYRQPKEERLEEKGKLIFKVNEKYIDGNFLVLHEGHVIFAGRDNSSVNRFKNTQKYQELLKGKKYIIK